VAAPELGHSVHVDVTRLEPDRWYYYRFIAGGEASPTGRTRTFAPVGAPADRRRFAFASCQHYSQGYFTAYDTMMGDDLDLIVHLGDYIYESDWGGPAMRYERTPDLRALLTPCSMLRFGGALLSRPSSSLAARRWGALTP
jgi:alkaline phosphatase D